MAKLHTLTSRVGFFCRENSGQNLMEYALVVFIVAIGVIASVRSVQTAVVNGIYNGVGIVLSSF